MSRSRLFLSLAVVSLLLLSFAGIAQAQTGSGDSSNGTIGLRKLLANGEAFSDEFTSDATAYLYGFLGSKGDSITISMTQSDGSDLDPFIVLLGPKGEMLASDDDSGTDVFASSLISDKELPDDGVYLVMATTFAHIDEILIENSDQTAEPTDQTFDITVTGNTEPASTDQALIFTKDMGKGDTFDGDSTLDNPVGYFTYAGKAGETISITTEPQTDSDGNGIDTILHVFDPAGNRIAANDEDPSGSTFGASGIHDLTLPEDGLYMIFATDVFFYNAGIKDSSLEFKGGKYTISVS